MRKRFFVLMIISTLILTACTKKVDYSPSDELWLAVHNGLQLDSTYSKVNVSTDVFSYQLEPSPDEYTYIHLIDATAKEMIEYFDLDIHDANDTLHITAKGKKRVKADDLLDLINGMDTKLLIQLPAKTYKEVSLNSHVGKIEYDTVDVDKLEVSNDVGGILISDTETQHTKVKSSVGHVNLVNVNGALDIKNSTGPIKIDAFTLHHSYNINNELSTVAIEFQKEPEAARLDLQTELGSVQSNFNMDIEEKSRRTLVGQYGNDPPEIKVRTSIGKITVHYKD